MAYVNQLHQLEFDTNSLQYHDICHVTGTIYATAYQGGGSKLTVTTLNITTEGIVSVLDSYQDPAILFPHWFRLIHLADNVICVLFEDNGQCLLRTFSVNPGTGAIANIDSATVDLSYRTTEDQAICHISGTIYGIVYLRGDFTGQLVTIDIADNGIIGAQADSWQCGGDGSGEDFIHISGTTYAIITRTNLFTLTIAANGVITPAVIDTYTLTGANVEPHGRIVSIAGTKYAVVWRNSTATTGVLATLDIQAGGAITEVETLTFDDVGLTPDIIPFYTGVFYIVYKGSDSWVRGKQVEIADDGNIGSILNCHPTSQANVYTQGYFPVLVHVAGTTSIIACIWRGSGSDGYIETMGLRPSVTTQAVTDIVSIAATGNGNVTDLGEPNPTQHGHCWDTFHDPTTFDDKTELGAVVATGPFASNIIGLLPGTRYYVRAYVYSGQAGQASSTTYGAEVSFDTPVTAGSANLGSARLLI